MSSGKIALENMSKAAWYNRWTIRQFEPFLKGNILEVGCGTGNFTNQLSSYGKVYGIDIRNNYIKCARKKAKHTIIGFGNIETGKYFFKKKLFDTIICINVLEHIKNDNLAFKNIYGLLKKDGYLILLVPSHQSLFGQIDKAIKHFRRYDKKELIQKINSMGLEIIKARRLNFLGGLGWWLIGKILKENTVKENRIKVFNIFGPFFLTLETTVEPPLGTSILIVAKKD